MTNNRHYRATKIVATLGPATSTEESIRKLVEVGADVFRLNFSHGKQEDHGERLAIIRKIERELGRPIAVLGDLQGPKLRIGTFADGPIALTSGMRLRLDLDRTPGNRERVCLPHPEIIEAARLGNDLLLNDGRVRLNIVDKGTEWLDTVVVTGTELSDRKGVNVPDVVLPLSPLTEKDRSDLRYALDIGVDWIALSFVQRPEDVAEARRLIAGRASLMVKLEKPSAIEHLEQLIEAADAVMVARGDLGVEVPAEDVPAIQKRIIRESRMAGKPVIVATQMLESMVSAPTPTRAEASDVATAVYDGADAVMLSAETASGAYPAESVAIMSRICQRVESDTVYRTIIDSQRPDPESTSADAVTSAARQVADTVRAAAIVTYTTSGSTALRAARERPVQPILGLTCKPETARRLVLSYGVRSICTEDIHSFSEMVSKATELAAQNGLASSGDRLVVTAGVPFGTPGNTNTLRIAWVD